MDPIGETGLQEFRSRSACSDSLRQVGYKKKKKDCDLEGGHQLNAGWPPA